MAAKAATREQSTGPRGAKGTRGTTTPSGHKKKHKKRKETYSSYTYKILKQIHPDTSISTRAMSIVSSIINDMFERVATEASKLAIRNRKYTLSSRDLQTAVRLILPPELARHAVSEATKAVCCERSASIRLE